MSHEHEHHHEEFTVHDCDGAGHEHHHHEDGTCCCEQHAKEFHGIEKPMLIRLILAALCYLAGMLLPVGEIGELFLMLACALLAGYDIVLKAGKNLAKGRFFDEYFLMSFAAIAAFLIGEAEEGAAVFLLYRVGAFCQSYAIRHSRRTIAGMTGTHIHTEEPQTTNAFISRFSKIYTPIILGLAVLIAAALPLISTTTLRESIYRALTFLVLACPCAIVISVPLTYFAGISAAARNGAFFHDSEALDSAAEAKKVPEISKLSSGSEEAYVCKLPDTEEHALLLKDPNLFPLAKTIAKKTRNIAKENIIFTIAVKLTVLILSVCGISALWFAVFADSGVTVIVVLNALRAFRSNGTI